MAEVGGRVGGREGGRERGREASEGGSSFEKERKDGWWKGGRRDGETEGGREGGRREGGLSVTLSLSRARITEQLADAWWQAGTGAGAVETFPAPARAQAAAPGMQPINDVLPIICACVFACARARVRMCAFETERE